MSIVKSFGNFGSEKENFIVHFCVYIKYKYIKCVCLICFYLYIISFIGVWYKIHNHNTLITVTVIPVSLTCLVTYFTNFFLFMCVCALPCRVGRIQGFHVLSGRRLTRLPHPNWKGRCSSENQIGVCTACTWKPTWFCYHVDLFWHIPEGFAIDEN